MTISEKTVNYLIQETKDFACKLIQSKELILIDFVFNDDGSMTMNVQYNENEKEKI